jgi:uncharacterized protein YjbI with pentapeptide repeats
MTSGDEPHERNAESTSLDELSDDDLMRALEAHKRWLSTRGREGRQLELSGAKLDRSNLRLAVLSEANLQDANLEHALIEGGRLQSANLQNATLRGSDLRRAFLHKTNLQGADLYEANLQEASLQEANLQGANLMMANLRQADLYASNLQRAFLKEAQLQGASLQGANLQGANLQHANGVGASLQRAIMDDANLSHVNLRAADLQGARLQSCNLQEASLQQANLQHTDFTGCIGLVSSQFGGSDFSAAKFSPDTVLFSGLHTVRDLTRQARRLFLFILCSCLLAWLCINATTDARLLTSAPIALFPDVTLPIPTVTVYHLLPILLAMLYIYQNLYLQRLWEELANLPAVFPDGRPLDRSIHPWLPNGLIRAHNMRLRQNRPPLSHLQTSLCIFFIWWLVPFTLLAFWLYGLPRHDWLMTFSHLNLTVISCGFAVLFQGLAGTALQGRPFRRYKHGALAILLAGIILTVLSCISFGALTGAPPRVLATNQAKPKITWPFSAVGLQRIVPQLLIFIGHGPFAELAEAELSTQLPSPASRLDIGGTIRGADLRQRNLQYANAVGASLVNADLRAANLVGADLRYADLRGARLQGANLFRANLKGANLRTATGVTHGQLQTALVDQTTLLPIITMP